MFWLLLLLLSDKSPGPFWDLPGVVFSGIVKPIQTLEIIKRRQDKSVGGQPYCKKECTVPNSLVTYLHLRRKGNAIEPALRRTEFTTLGRTPPPDATKKRPPVTSSPTQNHQIQIMIYAA